MNRPWCNSPLNRPVNTDIDLYGTGECNRCGGMPALQPHCPDCQARFLQSVTPSRVRLKEYEQQKKAEAWALRNTRLCPECEESTVIPPDDYLCTSCRSYGTLYNGL